MVVPLRVRGATLGIAIFVRHRRNDPFKDNDLVLAEKVTARTAICIDNARRYTHDVTPPSLSSAACSGGRYTQQAAVDAAFRYLPAGSHRRRR